MYFLVVEIQSICLASQDTKHLINKHYIKVFVTNINIYHVRPCGKVATGQTFSV